MIDLGKWAFENKKLVYFIVAVFAFRRYFFRISDE